MSAYSVAELRKMATEQKIPGRSKLTRKADLLKVLGLDGQERVKQEAKNPSDDEGQEGQEVEEISSVSEVAEAMSLISFSTKREVAEDLMHRITAILNSGDLTYDRFMQWFNQLLYIKEMEKSNRYTLSDMKSYDVEGHYLDDVVIEFETGLLLFYSMYKREKLPSNEKVEMLEERYSVNKGLVFQKLFRKYIQPEFAVKGTDWQEIIVL